MNKIIDFAKTTMIGGLLVILPLALIAFLLQKAMDLVEKVLGPITTLLPAGTYLPHLISLLAVIGVCFLTGLIFGTSIGQRIFQASEHHVLEHIPGYTLIRSLSRQLAGDTEGVTFSVALVEIEEALVPAFLVEEHQDGSFTVFVPASPTPTVGSLYILPAARVHPVDVPLAKAIKCITRWGLGSGELLQAMRRGSMLT